MLFLYYIDILGHFFTFNIFCVLRKMNFLGVLSLLWILVRSLINWTIIMGIYFGVCQKFRYFVGMADEPDIFGVNNRLGLEK